MHHLVAVKDGDLFAIYYNRDLIRSAFGEADCDNFIPARDIGNFYIGHNFAGKIDDVIIYDRPLDNDEISNLYGVEMDC